MRILMVHNDYAKHSGEEHAVENIAKLLQENGNDVAWQRRTSADIKGGKAKIKAFFTGIHNPAARNEMDRYLASEKVDIVQIQNLFPHFSPAVVKAFRKRGLPVVMRCPNYRLFCPTGLHLRDGVVCEKCLGPGREIWCFAHNCMGSRLKSLGYTLRGSVARISRSLLDGVDTFVVLSEFQRQRFIANGVPEDRISIVPNFEWEPPAAEGPAPKRELILFVGRVSKEKGIDDFLALAKAMPHEQFAVAGNAEEISESERKAFSNVQFLGFLKSKELDALYRKARLLVFPGRWFEGFPNVITRAMYLQVPVIGSRLGAIPEIVSEGVTGELFEPGNIDELVEKTRTLLAAPERCAAQGAAGLEKARKQYSPAAAYAAWSAAYKNALRQATGR